MIQRFNIRIYGIWVHNKKVLLSQESSSSMGFIKFPGGGMEFGEGPVSALKREFIEELDVNITQFELYHIHEDFVESAFNPEEQLVAIYYMVQCDKLPTNYGFEEIRWKKPYTVEFFWQSLQDLESAQFKFPADKAVALKLVNHFKNPLTE